VLHHPHELIAWLDAELSAPEPAAPLDRRRHRSAIGVAARMVGRLDVAERCLARACTLAELHGTDRDLVPARVRHAHVLQWQGRLALATAVFAQCLAGIAAAGDAGHLVYQHAGKCAYEAHDFSRAAELFSLALRMRRAVGDVELIESSELALRAAVRAAGQAPLE
jgi:tetratricopeptide (TPR) repeat protein